MKDDLDEKIKQDLNHQAKELNALVDGGLIDYLKLSLSSNFSLVMKFGYILATILTILIVYCGYNFYMAIPEMQLFWAVCLIISFNAQIATKLWIFMQTNRNITSRELRIIELRLRKIITSE